MSSEGRSMLRSLNHVSRVCKDVQRSAAFYRELLGFVDMRRPGFDFEGAWLYSPHCAVGLHLIKGEPIERSSCINPKADHLSFVCCSLAEFEESLLKRNVHYIKQSIIEEDGVRVTQLFLHDPENNMIEICNCDELPVQLLSDMDTAVGCTACQQHPTWANVPLASKSLADSHEDTMSEHSSHSGSAGDHDNTLFSGLSDCALNAACLSV